MNNNKYRVRVNINGQYAYTFSLPKPTIKAKLTVKGPNDLPTLSKNTQ